MGREKDMKNVARKWLQAAAVSLALMAPGTALAAAGDSCPCGATRFSSWPWWGAPRPVFYSPAFLAMQQEMERMNWEMERLFQDVWSVPAGFYAAPYQPSLLTSVNLNSTPSEYTVNVNAPGLDEKDVKVRIEQDGVLTIEAEKKIEHTSAGGKEQSYGSFRQVMSLPRDADTENFRTQYRDGVLTVTVPRKTAEKNDRMTHYTPLEGTPGG
jgi:HSP20 family protein